MLRWFWTIHSLVHAGSKSSGATWAVHAASARFAAAGVAAAISYIEHAFRIRHSLCAAAAG